MPWIERQDLPCTYLAYHELESNKKNSTSAQSLLCTGYVARSSRAAQCETVCAVQRSSGWCEEWRIGSKLQSSSN